MSRYKPHNKKNKYRGKKMNTGIFWVLGTLAVVALLYFIIPPIEPSFAEKIITQDIYRVSAEPTMTNSATAISSDWLTNKNKCLTLLYPHITECGLGVVQYNSKTYVTAIIRKSEVWMGDRRYIEGINYYFKYCPKGTDNSNIDWDICKVNQSIEEALLDNVNAQRDTNNYNLISSNKELTDKARTHSASMALQGQEFTYGINSPYYVALWYEK